MSSLEFGPGDIEDTPTLLAFCETCSEEEKKALEEAMSAVGKPIMDKQKASIFFGFRIFESQEIRPVFLHRI